MSLDFKNENIKEINIEEMKDKLIEKFKLNLALEISLIDLKKEELIKIINEIYK